MLCTILSLRAWLGSSQSRPIFLYWPAGSSRLQAGSCCQWAETSGWCEENCEASKSTRAQCNPPEPKTSLPREKVRLQPKLASLYWSGQFRPLPAGDSYSSRLISNKGSDKSMLVCGNTLWAAHKTKTWLKSCRDSREAAKWNTTEKETVSQQRGINHSEPMSPVSVWTHCYYPIDSCCSERTAQSQEGARTDWKSSGPRRRRSAHRRPTEELGRVIFSRVQ